MNPAGVGAGGLVPQGAGTASPVVREVPGGPDGTRFVRPVSPRERVLDVAYFLKGRYVRMAFRYPRLFVEGLRRPDLGYLLQRAETLEFDSPTMQGMFRASTGKSEREFTLGDRRYPYCYAEFNHAWGTERTVEVPIALDLLRRSSPQRTLEVGNVLSHYAATEHLVVDRYELGPHVVNEDIADYDPPGPLDLIVSVSTLEHVGWDEVPRERDKLLRVVRRLRSWLSPSGEAWVTVPLGYNRWLDRFLVTGELGIDRAFFLRRLSFDNRWEECPYDAVARAQYGGPINRAVDHPPFPRANALGVLQFRRG